MSDPTQTLPDPPPEFTDCDCEKCESCENIANWWEIFQEYCQWLGFAVNVHQCRTSIPADEKRVKRMKSCINSMGIARHNSRQILKRLKLILRLEHSTSKRRKVDKYIDSIVTYLLRCNTDITSLLGGVGHCFAWQGTRPVWTVLHHVQILFDRVDPLPPNFLVLDNIDIEWEVNIFKIIQNIEKLEHLKPTGQNQGDFFFFSEYLISYKWLKNFMCKL